MPPDPEQNDDIEILEVVGVDEDGVPVETEDPEDVEVVFDEVPSIRAVRPAAPPPEDPALKERFLRLQADFENYKRRVERERGDYFRHATSGLVGRILPVLDNFERAVAAGRGRSDAVAEGVVLIQRQLLEELSREGLHPMDPVGSLFDPEMHEAVATDPTSEAPPGTVTAVLQRGWFFHDRVLRAALVRVSVDGGAFPPAPGGEES
jgi:molecular chaperone GrpE (heat shock protein)